MGCGRPSSSTTLIFHILISSNTNNAAIMANMLSILEEYSVQFTVKGQAVGYLECSRGVVQALLVSRTIVRISGLVGIDAIGL